MTPLAYVRFIVPIDIGGQRLEYWSIKRGETSELCQKTTGVVMDQAGRVKLTWTGAGEGRHQTVWVGAANIANWEVSIEEKKK